MLGFTSGLAFGGGPGGMKYSSLKAFSGWSDGWSAGASVGYGAQSIGASVSHRSEEHTSELQSLMRISYAVFCLKKKNNKILIQKYILQVIIHTEYTNITSDANTILINNQR